MGRCSFEIQTSSFGIRLRVEGLPPLHVGASARGGDELVDGVEVGFGRRLDDIRRRPATCDFNPLVACLRPRCFALLRRAKQSVWGGQAGGIQWTRRDFCSQQDMISLTRT